MTTQQFHGSNVIFWIGCVEDINDDKAEDKLKLGRVRVRIIGYHSETKIPDNKKGEGIPTNQLLWAYPIGPITSASVSGIGQSPLGLVKGSWVMGLSMDGRFMQDLYILGTLAGVPEERLDPEDQGFCDPTREFPLKDFMEESDINRLARNDTDKPHPILAYKEERRIRNIPTVGGGTWEEPPSAYEAIYPHNYVTETPNGHITEIDDSVGLKDEKPDPRQRTHRWHPSGTYEEIDASGSRVVRIEGADFEIVLENKHLYVIGNLNITVAGNANILVEKDCNVEAMGNMDLSSRENIVISADKTLSITAKNLTVHTEQALSMTASGPVTFWGVNSNPNDAASGIA